MPAYKLAALKARFPETTFVNLNFEVDYLLWRYGDTYYACTDHAYTYYAHLNFEVDYA